MLFKNTKTSDDIFIKISRDEWQKFINCSCNRYEVNPTQDKEYAYGFIKGVQVALLDLLSYTDKEYFSYRDDVSELEDRLRLNFGLSSDIND